MGLTGNSEGKALSGRHRRRWDYNLKMVFKEIALEGVDFNKMLRNSLQAEELVTWTKYYISVS